MFSRCTKMLVMAFFWMFLCFLAIINGTKAEDNNKSTAFEETLKDAFSCNLTSNQNLVTKYNKVIKNVCVTKHYDPGYHPKDAHVTLTFQDKKIVNIDDKKKTITLDIVAQLFWEDKRITAFFHDSNPFTELPPVTAEEPAIIWTPFQYMYILNLRSRRYLTDPYMINLGLLTVESANQMIDDAIFSGDVPVAFSFIIWSLTISCPFNFPHFPFDKTKCPLIMRFRSVDASFETSKTTHIDFIKQTDMDGFKIDLKQTDAYNSSWANIKATEMKVDIILERQVSKYVFQYYIPCITIVIATSFSFIIPLSAIPGRIALIVTQFLTLTNIFINQMVSLAQVSNIKL